MILPTCGIIGYASRRGLGIMTHEFRKHLGIEHQLVIPDEGWSMDFEWAAGQFMSLQWAVDRDTLAAWILEDKIDTIISIETSYGDHTFRWCKELEVKTILIVMWEWFNPTLPAYQNVDLYICPSYKSFEEVPFENKLFVPCPVDTEEIKFKERTGPAELFIHNAGSGGMGGRKGTNETVRGFLLADVDARLEIRTQVDPLTYECYEESEKDDRISWKHGTVENYADLYAEGDVLICVHHYDGQCLVAEEAMAAGLPVITTDAAPMNEFFSDDQLLVRVENTVPAETINRHCERNIVNVEDLADKIRWCASVDLSEISNHNRWVIESEYSWERLQRRWVEAIVKAKSIPIW